MRDAGHRRWLADSMTVLSQHKNTAWENSWLTAGPTSADVRPAMNQRFSAAGNAGEA